MKKAFVALFLFCFAVLANAELKFKNLYSDGLILQAGVENAIAGYANPNAKVEIGLNFSNNAKKTVFAKSDKNGKWIATLPKMPSKTELEIKASSEGESAEIKNVKVGQLWLASGQSNMDWHFDRGPKTPEYEKYLKDICAGLEKLKGNVRIYKTRQKASFEPLENIEGKWREPDLKDIKSFSALPLLFAKYLCENLGEPVGVIVSSWGGSPIERWIPREAFGYSDFTKSALKRDAERVEGWQERQKIFLEQRKVWLEKNNTPELRRQNRKSEPRFDYDPFDRSTPTPAMLFNGMIFGIYPTVPKGVIWYQGESNDKRANEYGDLAKAMVLSWRKYFKSEFPFYYVELANLGAPQKIPVEGRHSWGAVREAQGAVLELPKTGVATCADVGDEKDLHPPYKDAVARRLGNLALTQIYGKGDAKSALSPCFKSAKFNGDNAEISISNAWGLRLKKGKKSISGFAARGDGKMKWHFANAEIKNGKIIVSSPEIERIQAVRYGWAGNPDLCVENKFSMPLRPFSTDKGSILDYMDLNSQKAELSFYPE